MTYTAPQIEKDVFVEILQNNEIVQADDLLIFQTLYSLKTQKASASDLARIIGWSGKNTVINKITGLGKRILKKYEIKQSERQNGKKRFWDFFFTGYHEGSSFIYQLRPEIKEALQECDLTKQLNPISNNSAFLFIWNPKKWSQWTDPENEPYIEKDIEELKNTGKVRLMWSCCSHKSIKPGDRAFLAKVGSTPRGIFGSGTVVSNSFLSKHWNSEEKDVHRVWIEFDVLFNPEKSSILSLDKLNQGNLAKQQWTPQSSGVSIKQNVIDELEEEWFHFIEYKNNKDSIFIETNNVKNTYVEGATTKVKKTVYERNPYARNKCIEHYGHTCSVCGFDFEEFYGNLGYQFIHVHHLTPMAMKKSEYKVNPIKDLRPVCPNCHSMLHKQNPPLTIEELKALIKK